MDQRKNLWYGFTHYQMTSDVKNCIANPRENAIKAIILVYVLGTYTSQTLPPHRTNS